MQNKIDLKYNDAVQSIKQAILSSQLRATRHVNEEQLALYFGIGKYISENTREGKWGTGAVESISRQLSAELPGLKGYSATNLKYMRIFYEAWSGLDKSSATAAELGEGKSSAADTIPATRQAMKAMRQRNCTSHLFVTHAIKKKKHHG